MNKYTVYFEIFGKKVRATVSANSEEEAKYLVSGQILKKVKFTEVQKNNIGQDLFNKLFNGFN